jgi:UDP-N-acetylglucosamine transferase subunit ALG13
MIFVTVGSDKGFPRLMSAVDRLRSQNLIQEHVLLQIGANANFKSEVCEVVTFLAPAEFERCMRDASVVICHGGAGTMIFALQARKVPVVMPRRKVYGEHIDDHQLEGAQALAAEGRIILAPEVDDLPAAIAQARLRGMQSAPEPPSTMIELVSRGIEELLHRSPRRRGCRSC